MIDYLTLVIAICGLIGALVNFALLVRRTKSKSVRLAAVKVVNSKPMPDLRRRDRRAMDRARRGDH